MPEALHVACVEAAAAHVAATPAWEVKEVAYHHYDDAFSTYRTDYLERYRMRLGNPAWNDQLDRGFHRGFATTPHTFRSGVAGLTTAEVDAHVNTTAEHVDMKQRLVKVYDHYIKTLNTYFEVFDEAYELAIRENDGSTETELQGNRESERRGCAVSQSNK